MTLRFYHITDGEGISCELLIWIFSQFLIDLLANLKPIYSEIASLL